MHKTAKSEKPLDLMKNIFRGLIHDLDLEYKDLRTVLRRIDHEGLEFVTKTLPLLGKSLEKGISDGHLTLPTNFKRSCKSSALPALLGSLFSDVFDSDGTYLGEKACCVAVYAIRQFCYFAYKCDLPRRPDLDQNVIDNFIDTEKELEAHPPESFSTKLVAIAAKFMKNMVRKYESPTDGRHGPGVVSNSSFLSKWDKPLANNLPIYRKFSKFYFYNDHHAISGIRGGMSRGPSEVLSAKVLLVPKDSRGPRLISCEPAEHMYVQQGIMDRMVPIIENHTEYSGQVNFTDQSINRDLAIKASAKGGWSTLDLKEASDRVHIDLVKRLFKDSYDDGNPLLYDLLVSRTPQTILPSGDILELTKFAPMGSALCFPVLALTCWAISMSAIICSGKSSSFAKESVFVYGDDIIVRNETVPFVINALESVGLKVNRSKSFIDSDFAESCGMDAFQGNDVTPIKLRALCDKKGKKKPNDNPTAIVKMVKCANSLELAGLRMTAKTLYGHCESFLGSLPYGHQFSSYLCKMSKTSHIEEENYLKVPHLWKATKNIQRYPAGATMKAWTLESVTINYNTDIFTTLWKKQVSSPSIYDWTQLFDPSVIPVAGSVVKPKSTVLRSRRFCHYDMTSATP